MRKACIIILSVLFCSLFSEAKKKQDIPAPYAWSITQPLGSRYDVPMDTLMHNFYSTDIPSSYSTAYGTTGNLGAAAFSKIFFDRPLPSEFIFKDPFGHWIQTASSWKFYNSHIPYTQLSYLTGGSKQTAQDDLKAVFSGNFNQKLEFGGSINISYREATTSIKRRKTLHTVSSEAIWETDTIFNFFLIHIIS